MNLQDPTVQSLIGKEVELFVELTKDRKRPAIAKAADAAALRIHERLTGRVYSRETAEFAADLKAELTARMRAPGSAPKTLAQRGAEAARHAGDFWQDLVGAALDHPAGPTVSPGLLAAATGLNQGVPSEGGFLVPPQQGSVIWDNLNSRTNSLAALCDTYTVPNESLSLPANAETSRAQGSLYGGLTTYWIGEADQFTASKPKLRTIKLEPQELVAMVFVTDKVLNNSGAALGEYLAQAAGNALGHRLDAAIVSGHGAGQPLGLLNSPATVSVAKESGQAAGSVLPVNVQKMAARVHPGAWASAVWVAHPSCASAVWGLTGQFDPATERLLGRRVIFSDVLPVLGTVGDLILWDPQSYAIGTRGTERAMSIHVRFEYAEMAYRFKFAVDGQAWLSSAIAPAVGYDPLATCVTLATRA